MISVRNLKKVYKLKGKGGVNNVVALNSVNIDFPDKGLVFLLGKSGSGKSTLLNSIGGLDTFDEGEIIIKGKSSKDFKQSDFDSYRNTFIGFIFQEYNILEEFTVGKNLALALELQGKKADKAHVNALLEEVDLGGYYKRKPNQLSGGQKQRVAIARALIKDPEIIMADEPTGALDSNTGKQVMDTLKKLSKHKLVIIVSHDREFAEIYGDRIIELKDGNIIRDDVKTEVEAVKSESGVSFIDDKIIHIKKGQQITKEDLIKINQMIVHNSHNEDTIISFDAKSNTDVKKSAFITDDGNREVFKQTEPEDIERAHHDPRNFKMIKSKLKMKDAFKMGASSLKTKPIRLIFTILLSVFAFGMFGVVNTMSSFNRADSVCETLEQLDIKTVAINKNVDSYNTYTIGDASFEKFQKDNPDYNLHKVIASGKNFGVQNLSSSSSPSDYNSIYNTLRRDSISGMMVINENTLTELNLQLVEGRLPNNTNLKANEYSRDLYEVCISSNLMNTIKNKYLVNSINDLASAEFYVGNYDHFKIVGVIKDDTDISKYINLKGDEASRKSEENLWNELNVIMNYSLVNMCYLHEDIFNICLNKTTNEHIHGYQPYVSGEDDIYGGSYMYYKSSQDRSYHPTLSWSKNGATYEQLTANMKDNQAIIPREILTNSLKISTDDLISKLDAGLKVSFCYGYEGKDAHAFELEIVGYWDGTQEIVVSDEFYNEFFAGADYIITRLKGNNQDKALIKYFENYNDKAINYNVQFEATPVLDEFGGMIESMANILLYVGIGLAVFSGLMLMNFISTSIAYKKREIGVLRAIGARGKDVFSIFFSESFIICMINFVLSAIATGVISSVINNIFVSKMGVTLTLMMFGIKQIALLFVVAMGVAFIASFLPVYKFAKKNPIDSINNR